MASQGRKGRVAQSTGHIVFKQKRTEGCEIGLEKNHRGFTTSATYADSDEFLALPMSFLPNGCAERRDKVPGFVEPVPSPVAVPSSSETKGGLLEIKEGIPGVLEIWHQRNSQEAKSGETRNESGEWTRNGT